jgi:hypothetical protein
MMRIRSVRLEVLLWSASRYATRRVVGRRGYLTSMIEPADGRQELSAQDRRDALVVDAMLRRLGVRCIWRAAIVTDMLRRRGVAARIALSVGGTGSTFGHAEAEVGGESLRPHPGGALLR